MSTNERDERYFDLYEISVDGYKKTVCIGTRRVRARAHLAGFRRTSRSTSKLLYLSDTGREFMTLLSYTIGSGQVSEVYAQNWDILAADYSNSGKPCT